MSYFDVSPEQRTSTIQGLRDFADFLEDNEDFVPNYWDEMVSIDAYCASEENFVQCIKALPGKRDKTYTDWSMTVTKEFGNVKVKVWTSRDTVCTRRQVSTKTVTREVPVKVETVEEEVPVYEWSCEDSILNA